MNEVQQQIANAVTDLKSTTISYPDWKHRVDSGRYIPRDGSSTLWGKAFSALTAASKAAESVPVTSPEPTPPYSIPGGIYELDEPVDVPANSIVWFGIDPDSGKIHLDKIESM